MELKKLQITSKKPAKDRSLPEKEPGQSKRQKLKRIYHQKSDSDENEKPLKKDIQIVQELSPSKQNVSGSHNDKLLNEEETSVDETSLNQVWETSLGKFCLLFVYR